MSGQGKSQDPAVQRVAKNAHAVALGRMGGRKGGPARANALAPERRAEIARTAARARWDRASQPRPGGMSNARATGV